MLDQSNQMKNFQYRRLHAALMFNRLVIAFSVLAAARTQRLPPFRITIPAAAKKGGV